MRDEAAIGAILTCPKCESMVQVVPPQGWQPGGEAAAQRQGQETGSGGDTPTSGDKAMAKDPKPADTPKPEAQPPAANPAPAHQPGPSGKPAPPVDPALADTVDDFPELQSPVSGRVENARAAPHSVPPPLPPVRPRPEAPAELHLDQKAAAAAVPGAAVPDMPPAAPSPTWTSPAEAMWRKWLILATAPVAGLVVAAGLISLLVSHRGSASEEKPAAEAPADPDPSTQPDPKPEAPALPVRLDPQWVPDQTRMLMMIRLARLDKQPEFDRLLDLADPAWREGVDRLMAHFGLTRQAVGRIYWSSTDLTAWPEHSVVVIELEEGQDAGAYESRGRSVDLSLAGAVWRQEPQAAWPHPFAVIHPRLVVTGTEELLRRLADRGQPDFQSRTIGQLLKSTAPEVDAALMLDLAAARKSGWRLPIPLLDVWPAGQKAWHVAWEVPQGVGFALRVDERVHTELALVCEAQTPAEKVHGAVEELLPAGQTALAGQIASLDEKLQAGRIKADVAEQYETLLKQAQAGLKVARCEVVDDSVWLRIGWKRSLSDLALAALQSRSAIRADWLAAALSVDEANQRRVMAGLGGYQRAEGHFPAGAVGGSLWKEQVQTRLSWIATMLPYLGQRDWHRQLEFGYSWNSAQNSKVTRRPLEAVVNPALGPGTTGAGFPVTHYVGVAGVGDDAAGLPADHPRAGIFGFGRTTRLEDITDGAGNTIAVLGVGGRLGAWGQGGHPTVRALSRPPYVDGPDGFGSGQPDGMLAGMADGSARFISKDVDPRVLELLATARGGGDVTAETLGPWPPVAPQPKPAGPSPKVAGPDQKPKPKEEPAAPEKVDVEVVKIDVRARLAQKIAEVNLPEVPLSKVIELLQSYSTLRIALDIETMEQLGVTPDDPITLRLRDATVGQVLEAALARRGLVYVVEGNHVLVTQPPKQREMLRRVRYAVSDLVGGSPDGAEPLARLVQTLVAPETWQAAGGQGTMEATDDALLVLQTDAVHYQVLTFCEKLRTARGLPLRSRLDPQLFALATRLDRARPRLSRPVTANFIQPTPLPEIVSYLEQISETTILVDWITLGTAGVSPDVKGTLKADKRPLSEALGRLLGPMQLAYRIVGVDTLQVTTRKAAADRLDLEFYAAADLLGKDRAPEALAEQIKGQVAAGTWSEAGGPGTLHFDAPGQCLIVLQSQPVQAELEGLLSQWRTERKPAAKD